MDFSLHAPSPFLSDYVEAFWHVSGYVPYQRDKILPTEHIELIINLADHHRVYADVQDERFILNENAWICGLQRSYLVTEAMGRSELVGIRFKPAGLFPFLGMPVAELDDLIIELECVWGCWIEEIREQLFHCQSVAGRFAILEHSLRARYQQPDQKWHAMQYCAAYLSDPNHPLSIADLAEGMGYSQRHLIKQFRRVVGLTPKLFARINRFHRILQRAGRTRSPDWGDLAYQCGYYDQAHFSKDFRSFSGLNPQAYTQLRAQFLTPPLDPGDAVKFVPIE